MRELLKAPELLTIRRCPECDDEVAFERPDCLDGHGPDCPDLACTGCGLAVFAAGPTPAASAGGAADRITAGRIAAGGPTAERVGRSAA